MISPGTQVVIKVAKALPGGDEHKPAGRVGVFQICTLRDIRTERERRQTLGRGLRLCVNHDGYRLRGFEVNTLTVVATESYQQFAENLQKDIEQDTGIRFGLVEPQQFAAISTTDAAGNAAPLGFEPSKTLWQHMEAEGYIDSKGQGAGQAARGPEGGQPGRARGVRAATGPDYQRTEEGGRAAGNQER